MDTLVNARSAAAVGCECYGICPLSKVPMGMRVRIRQHLGSPETVQRLREIGLCEDQVIKLLSCQANVICQVCNARLGVAVQLADSIMVEPLPLAAAA